MKRLIAAAALTIFAAGAAMAADTMSFEAKNGNVSFDHKKHQQVAGSCKACHEKGPGKIEGFGKDWAHKTCKGCHEEKKAGPTKCGECHKK
ncbi:cytochrome c7 [Geobacter benzoatilyticus]|jgi:cytochrome c553|uniref:Cytochrome c3 family protein n=1 Tax=Geobacter benzoatilyticus TaxID=2815309 RepID=A0ABX7Q5M3_9BACT|nr:cytochrome c7 [Geobacter benzoatilyticus]QSV46400.1 cytochrome c3 family protein [Geobacter benzoatilyticus]